MDKISTEEKGGQLVRVGILEEEKQDWSIQGFVWFFESMLQESCGRGPHAPLSREQATTEAVHHWCLREILLQLRGE